MLPKENLGLFKMTGFLSEKEGIRRGQVGVGIRGRQRWKEPLESFQLSFKIIGAMRL